MANASVPSQTSTFHMVVSPISKLTAVLSPEVVIHGIPWKVRAYKNEEGNSLAVYLYCIKEDKSSTWAVAASAIVQLLPINNGTNTITGNLASYVFSALSPSLGFPTLIKWDDLLKAGSQYVRDDKIKLKIEITAENPNYVDRSILKFESIDKSCDCGSLATYRLTVTNVENLMAIRSPQSIVRGLPWDLTVYKDHLSALCVLLELNESAKKVSCKMTMSVKLLSSKNNANSIKKSSTDQVQHLSILRVNNLILWDEMMKPEKGYVNNDSIILEVELKADKPEGDVPNINQIRAAKRRRFECSICLEDIDGQDISTTPCCHLFCTGCITAAVRNRGACPLCQEPVQKNDLRRLYLSAGK